MWARIWAFLDGCFFGPHSERPGTLGLVLRILRYPYAVIRDLWRGEINLRAMGLVYTTLLSIIPLVAFAFAILKIFGARHDLEPIVYEFFRPVGGATAGELASSVVQFARRVSSGVVGSVGFAFLAWTLLGTIKKVEDSFNFVWHVDHPRSLARRTAEYLTLLIIGPLLLVGFIGLSHAALDTAAVQEVARSRLLRHAAIAIAPYAMVTVFFTGMYMLIPNTRVHWRPALIGAVVAGVSWAAVGKTFTAFVVYSTRLQIVYAGFAFIVTALLWTYFGWLILLAGAQLSFYIQNPTYLRTGLRELRLSNLETEQLALKLMYLVGRSHLHGNRHWTANQLATELGLPGTTLGRLIAALEKGRLLSLTDNDELVPARDIGRITVGEILDIARNQRSGDFEPRNLPIPSVDRIVAAMEEARRNRCGSLTLRDLVEETPRPALTLAASRTQPYSRSRTDS
ncbi:MAG TPA: YihY/virulence factor BrkB family protein [Steroidobacteraceae bacterium]|nr:YihY/virulence factor BrkB family protein [Steroidobacteraceae bacterium]